MRTKLKISEDLSLPIEAVTETLGFLGRRGSGKSYAAQKLAEEMHQQGAQFIVVDPVGIWYGLRLAADGKSPGLPIPVLGGLHGDIPLEATGGALIADLVIDRGVSVVLDVSQFESDADKARFARAFADRFFFRKKASPSAVHVFIEECQEFVPQNPQRDEALMLHAFTRMAKIGRNFGIGLSLISQRPQEVNKKVLNLTELLFAFQLTGPQERKTLQGWIANKGIDEDIEGVLPKLERGAPHVWSPAWLKISRVVHIGRKWTFDASSTPKVGKESATRELSPIDLEQLRTDMAATIEKAKAEDPKLLRAENARLRADLAKRPTEKVLSIDHDAVREAEQRGHASGFKECLDRLIPQIARLDGVKLTIDGIEEEARKIKGLPALVTQLTYTRHTPPAAPRPQQALQRAFAVQPTEGLTAPEQRVLDALAWWASIGVDRPDKGQIGFLAGYRVGKNVGGTFGNLLGALRGRGLIEYPGPGTATLTTAGTRIARAPAEAPSTETLQRAIHDRLDNTESRVLQAIIDAYPDQLTKQEAGKRSGYTVGENVGGTFGNILGRLRSLGLIDYPAPGKVAALPVLFLDR